MRKIKVVVLIMLLLNQVKSYGQKESNKELLKSIHKINSLDYNAENTDLTFLDEILLDKDVVVLGEHYHGDANMILLKSRIIKYLIEKHNYKTIFYELPYEDVNRINYLAKDSLAYLISLSTLLPVTDATWDLYRYLSANANNISFEGIDISMQRTCMPSGLYYDSIFTSTNNSTLISNWKFFGCIYSYSISFNKLSKKVFDCVKEKKENLLKDINTSTQFNDSLKIRYSLVVENMYREIVRFNVGNAKIDHIINEPIKRSIRDSTMFFNFKTLYENYYRGDKIIVIVSNYHASRNITSLHKGFKDLTLGDYLYDYLGDKVYTLAGTSYSGFIGTDNSKSIIPKHKKGSYEELLKNKKYKFAFVDLSKNNREDNLYLSAVGFNSIKLKNWNKVFDGILYSKLSVVDNEKSDLEIALTISLDSLYFIMNIYQMGYSNAVNHKKSYDYQMKSAFDKGDLLIIIRKRVVRFNKRKSSE